MASLGTLLESFNAKFYSLFLFLPYTYIYCDPRFAREVPDRDSIDKKVR